MNAPVKLIPLRCLQCDTPVPAQPDEVAWVCIQCGQGMRLDAVQNLVPLEVHYAAVVEPNIRGKPYWVAEGQVDLDRDSFGLIGKKTGEAKRFWKAGQRFFVPAFTGDLDTMLGLGSQYLINPPDLQPGPAVQFEPVTLPMEDVHALAEFIVLSIEAERKDKLSEVQVIVQLAHIELWILP